MNVSVIIPVYKAGNFIRKAVESALFHHEVKEIILVEDGSPDNSLQVCKTLTTEYNRVHLYQHPWGDNKGAGASRNLGIAKTTQEYICFLDADDYMTECRFEKEKEIFTENKDADGVYGAIGIHYYDDIGAKACEKYGWNENHITTVNKQILPEHLFDFIIGYKNNDNYKGYFHLDALTLKRNELMKKNILFDESLRLHQDSVFIYQCAYYLKLYTGEFENPVAIRGVHKDNRFINHENLSDSRSQQYKSLIKWSKESKLEKEYKDFFKGEYYNLNLKDFGVMKKIIRSCQSFFCNDYYRRKQIHKIVTKCISLFRY